MDTSRMGPGTYPGRTSWQLSWVARLPAAPPPIACGAAVQRRTAWSLVLNLQHNAMHMSAKGKGSPRLVGGWRPAMAARPG